MLRLLVEKELREAVRSPKFAVTFAACSFLVLLSFVIGARSHLVAVARHEAAKAENLRQLEGITSWLQVHDYRIFLPPQPLSALVTGIADDIGRTVPIAGRGEIRPDETHYNDDPILAVFRFLDLNFIFQIVLTLFAIVFAHDAVSREKERGTLRLALANAVPRSTYILGKIIGTYAALIVPLLIPFAVGCALLPLLGISLGGDEWARLSLVLLAGLLLVGAFIALSVLISSATRRASSSFLALLVIWIAAAFILPRASVLMAGRAVSVPSVDEIASKEAHLGLQLSREIRSTLGTFKPSSRDPQVAMKEFMSFLEQMNTERDRKQQELATRLEEERENRQAVQQRLALGLARISPTAVFSLAATTLAGTSLELPARLRDEAAAYRDAYGKFIFEKTGVTPGAGMRFMLMGGEEKPVDTTELPQFRYRPAGLAQVLPGSLVDLALLLIMNAAFLSGAVFLFNRYDVR